jgi:hypothetical protein
MLVMWLEGTVPSCNTPWRRIRSAAAPVCLAFSIGAASISLVCAARRASSEIYPPIGARGTVKLRIIRSMLFPKGCWQLTDVVISGWLKWEWMTRADASVHLRSCVGARRHTGDRRSRGDTEDRKPTS